MNQNAIQTKYRQTKVTNFVIINESCQEKNAIEIYSIHNEGKSAVAKRFIRTLQNKIYQYMTSISKNMYIDKLDGIINKYNNTYYSTIKMKHLDVKYIY